MLDASADTSVASADAIAVLSARTRIALVSRASISRAVSAKALCQGSNALSSIGAGPVIGSTRPIAKSGCFAESHLKSVPAPEHDAHPELPVVCPRVNIGGRRVRTISTVMRFDTAVEVTASELRVESMFPADDESEAFFRAIS